MSAARNDQPAFPNVGAAADHQFNGMTLRDYFAAKAMQGMCVGERWPTEGESKAIARISYSMADAMLAARDEK